MVVGALVAVILAAPALAHPLGNFTTNLHLGLEITPTEISLRLLVDMAEIPTFRERPVIDRSGDETISEDELADYAGQACPLHAADLHIDPGTGAVPIETTAVAAQLLPGQGGLDTLRMSCDYRSGLAITTNRVLTVTNHVYTDRIGWREITVSAANVEVTTNLPSTSPSRLLTAYPPGTPISVSDARIEVSPSPGAHTAPGPIGSMPVMSASAGGAVALIAAVALGMGHALAPGHGKTITAAYLVGRKGGVRQAVGLGLSVAVAHTLGVGILGLLTAVTTSRFDPARVYPWLSGVSALVITVIGLVMLLRALVRRSRHDHDHNHGHHDHNHEGPSKGGRIGWRSMAALGLAGGLVPSASAVVLLLGAVSRGDPWFGLALVAAFGLGMSAALVAAGLVTLSAVNAGWKLIGSGALRHRVEHMIPGLAGFLVMGVGLTLLWQAGFGA
ncbi:MAG: nickel/cobalt transporter [Acidimicrobiia bacterium]